VCLYRHKGSDSRAYILQGMATCGKLGYPKETSADSNEGGLVRLKYTFRFKEKFDEPNDDWLKCIEATIDELLGTYSKAKDNALSAAFGSRGKKRLNRVFDAIGLYTLITII
jgi:hypothetical protein